MVGGWRSVWIAARRLPVLSGACGVLLLGASRPALAHPIHTTLTEIVTTADGSVALRIRAFADDFSAAVARHAGARPRTDHAVTDRDAARYVLAVFRLEHADGKTVRLSFAGQRREGDVVWLELRASEPLRLAGAHVLNAMLFEIHADQVNVVKATYGPMQRTTLFSKGDEAKQLPAGR